MTVRKSHSGEDVQLFALPLAKCNWVKWGASAERSTEQHPTTAERAPVEGATGAAGNCPTWPGNYPLVTASALTGSGRRSLTKRS